MFKKSLLLATAAAAAAASFAAPVSAAEVKAAAYADLRYGLDYFNDTHSANPSDTTFENHGSYWGFKGSTEQNGIVGFGGYERWLDTQATTVGGYDLAREAYVGVKSEFGTVEFGTFATAYMDSGRKLDPFYATGAAGTGKQSDLTYGGQSHGLSFLNRDGNVATTPSTPGGFVKNQLAYTSPSFYGVTVNGGAMFNNTAGSNADDYAAGLEFTNWGMTIGAQYLDSNSGNLGLANNDKASKVYVAYNQKRWGANVSGERINFNAALKPDANYLIVNGWYGLMEGTRVAASYGSENETGADGTSFRVGLFYDVLDNFTTNIVYRYYNAKDSSFYPTPKDDQVISLGATFKFELSGTTNTH
jgi:hypothetical protein